MAVRFLDTLLQKSHAKKCIKTACHSFRSKSLATSFFTNIFEEKKQAEVPEYLLATAGKPIKCKAAIKWSNDTPFSIEEVEVATPRSREVRIKIVASGISCTDNYNFDEWKENHTFPVIRGHEGAGIVESVGGGVQRFRRGDHVIPIKMPQCRRCEYCCNNKTNLCSALVNTQPLGLMADGTTRFKCKGQEVKHFMGTSTFSQYTVVSEFSLCRVNAQAPLETACVLGCAIPTGLGAVCRVAEVKPNSTCAIFGLGPVGMAAIIGCRWAKAHKIYGIDVNPHNCDLAKQFGMTDFINAADLQEANDGLTMAQKLKNLAGVAGFDYTFECVGNVETMRTALESAHEAWGVSVVAGIDPTNRSLGIMPNQLLSGRKWFGTSFGNCSRIHVHLLSDKYVQGSLPVDQFITHTFPLEAINDAFELLEKGKCLKCVLKLD